MFITWMIASNYSSRSVIRMMHYFDKNVIPVGEGKCIHYSGRAIIRGGGDTILVNNILFVVVFVKK